MHQEEEVLRRTRETKKQEGNLLIALSTTTARDLGNCNGTSLAQQQRMYIYKRKSYGFGSQFCNIGK